MNQIEEKLKASISQAVEEAFGISFSAADAAIEIPKDKSHGDYATNTAMRLAKVVKQNPRMIAETLVSKIDKEAAGIDRCEIAGPGFINFTMKSDSLSNVIKTVLEKK
ncbi:MAG: arginine--tRNA ligase, partial [Erysipelotrichaceae bacterium]|nr:arginine--tRNA ligase [Erysipelotrichaceae bacterium]